MSVTPPLGVIKARRGMVRIDGHFGTLWHLPLGAEVTAVDDFELRGAAEQFGQSIDQLRKAAKAAAKATQQRSSR